MLNDLAPIVLFVYNRPQHTLQTLEALKKNELAGQSRLYIYADGPKYDASSEQLEKIKEVRTLLREQNWCGEVIIRESSQNRGLSASVINGVAEIVNEYGKVIVLEDDLVTDSQFLSFCNEGLRFYESAPDVYGVSGFAFANGLITTDTCLLPIGSSWGWATWADKWACFEKDPSILLDQIIAAKKEQEFDFGNYPYLAMLKANSLKQNDSWAIRFYASYFLKGGYFLFPKVTLVMNEGFDNSGTHCNNTPLFNEVFTNNSLNVTKLNPEDNQTNIQLIRQSFKDKISESVISRTFYKRVIDKVQKLISSSKL